VKFSPGVIPIFVEYYHKSDVVMADLIQRKITWSEVNKSRLALNDQLIHKLQVFNKETNRQFAASHESELAQQQAAANALAQWAYQQQVLRQNQKLISRQLMNSLVITDCQRFGDSIRCSSY
jgi:hypothetical protein